MATEQPEVRKDDTKESALKDSLMPAPERKPELATDELDNVTGGCANGQHMPLA